MKQDRAYYRAQRRAGAKFGFAIHLFAYVAVNLLLVVINLSVTPRIWWFKWPLLGWGIGLFFHWLAVLWGPGFRQRLVERELDRNQDRDF
jgi:hypothetical protein